MFIRHLNLYGITHLLADAIHPRDKPLDRRGGSFYGLFAHTETRYRPRMTATARSTGMSPVK